MDFLPNKKIKLFDKIITSNKANMKILICRKKMYNLVETMRNFVTYQKF